MQDEVSLDLDKVEAWQLVLRRLAIECEQTGQEELAEMYNACANLFYDVILSETFGDKKPIFNN